MGLFRREIPKYGTAAWKTYQHKQGKTPVEHIQNYQIWNEKNHGKLIENGWDFYRFPRGDSFSLSTPSELMAQNAAEKLRDEDNDVRVVAGYDKSIPRIKLFSIIFKPKNQ